MDGPIRGTPVRQKQGMILENKVVQKLKLEKKNVFYKKWPPKLILLNEFFFLKKLYQLLTQKIDSDGTISALFDER